MKKLFYFLSIVLLTMFSSCGTEYDDSNLIDRLDKLEEEQKEMQEQIDAQQKLLDALANKLTITDVIQTSNGYTITLSDGTSMTIKDGEPGDNFIESIVVSEKDVTFTLADGTVIVIPLGCSSSGSSDTYAENNKIYYTTSDNTKLFPITDASLYGAILISNTYKDGQGVLVFDDAVTKIGGDAFYECSSLTSVTIPDSVTEIGNYAFSRCSNLHEFKGKFASEDGRCLIIDGVLYSFAPAGLTEYTIPDSVTTIGNYAFAECYSLTSVTIPDSVTTIGDDAFESCNSLTSVYISDISAWCNISFSYSSSNPLYYAHNLYLNNELVTDLSIPDSVTTIRDYTFSNCSSLTSVTIGDSVTTIGDYAFYNCSSLTSITIPDSVTSIGSSAFYGCTSELIINSKIIGDNYTSQPSWLNGAKFTKLTIGDSVTSIGSYAFEDCRSLTSVTIGDSVTTIGYRAFLNCISLTSVTIGDSVTTIGDAAFYNCGSLTSVYCKATTPPAGGSDMFLYNASDREIYVPMESVEAYMSAEGWSNYKYDIEGYNF